MNSQVADLLLKKYGKHNPPQVVAGDTVKVHQRIKEGEKERIQIFEGLVIATKHGQSLDGTFTVRKIAAGGVGVERTYPLHSPNIVKVERTKHADVARAKLYYMRDRLGKAARFKNESRDYALWDETQAVAVEAIEEPVVGTMEEENELAEAVTAAEMEPVETENSTEEPAVEEATTPEETETSVAEEASPETESK